MRLQLTSSWLNNSDIESQWLNNSDIESQWSNNSDIESQWSNNSDIESQWSNNSDIESPHLYSLDNLLEHGNYNVVLSQMQNRGKSNSKR